MCFSEDLRSSAHSTRRSRGPATAESHALLARCRGLAESSEDAFGEALRLHTNPFEAARTALLLGERLRRAHRPGEARAHLRTAWETFERAGARPWARRAQEELRAAGESGQAPRPAVLDALTPQELRIAGQAGPRRDHRRADPGGAADDRGGHGAHTAARGARGADHRRPRAHGRVTAWVVSGPVGWIAADRHLADLAENMYRPEWTWILRRVSGPSSPPS
ncbi:hypothetical protein [Nonomuraea rhizosphaerae]|uniref:hypothetical protein n=1 Tax=Nonomuraea rhizosphaerae TaxID=2665663 RepID=UPI001C5F0CEA|nr:hypothetical protein [Nonomuraea rhizosphaerae]